MLCEEVEEYIEEFKEEFGLNEPTFNLTGQIYQIQHPLHQIILISVTITTLFMPFLLFILSRK